MPEGCRSGASIGGGDGGCFGAALAGRGGSQRGGAVAEVKPELRQRGKTRSPLGKSDAS